MAALFLAVFRGDAFVLLSVLQDEGVARCAPFVLPWCVINEHG